MSDEPNKEENVRKLFKTPRKPQDFKVESGIDDQAFFSDPAFTEKLAKNATTFHGQLHDVTNDDGTVEQTITFEVDGKKCNIVLKKDAKGVSSLQALGWKPPHKDMKDVTDRKAAKRLSQRQTDKKTLEDGTVDADKVLSFGNLFRSLKNNYYTRREQQPKQEEEGFVRKLLTRYFKPKE